MRLPALLCAAAALLAARDVGGIRPRGAASDYPAHQSAKGVTVAAAVIPPAQVSKLFATDLNKAGYIVVEIAVYPETGNEVEVRSRDFLMRAGSEPATLRPVGAETIAARLHQKNAPKPPPAPGDITIYPTATIGYETGGYDPVTGQRRSGVYTATGVGVGIGQQPGAPPPPPPASTDRDRSTMEQELADKGLPETRTVDPVAGYLFFPKPSSGKAKNGPYHITYYGEHEQIQLDVPPLKK
jgi:hypothetical protein